MKVIGIDPGTAIVGWSYLEFDESGDAIKDSLEYGAITTDAGLEMPDRLVIISEELVEIIDKFSPSVVGVEDLFFSKNVKTAITVAQARGVILQVARSKGMEVIEMTPPQVKEFVTGYGNAGKAQVQASVKMLLGLEEIPKPDDAADAVAVAMCAAQMSRVKGRLG